MGLFITLFLTNLLNLQILKILASLTFLPVYTHSPATKLYFTSCFQSSGTVLFLQFIQPLPNSTFRNGDLKCTNTSRGSLSLNVSKQRKQRRHELLPANFSSILRWGKYLLHKTRKSQRLRDPLGTDNEFWSKSPFSIKEKHST